MPADTSIEYVKKCLDKLGEELPCALYKCLELGQADDASSLDVDGLIEGFIEVGRRHSAIVTDADEERARQRFEPFYTIFI